MNGIVVTINLRVQRMDHFDDCSDSPRMTPDGDIVLCEEYGIKDLLDSSLRSFLGPDTLEEVSQLVGTGLFRLLYHSEHDAVPSGLGVF